MRILFDGRLFTYRMTGVASLAIDAIRAIDKYLPDWEVIIAAPKPLDASVEGLPLGNKVKFVESHMFGIKKMKYKVWYDIHFPYLAKKFHADLIWSAIPTLPLFCGNSIKKMIIVNDVVYKEFAFTRTKSIRNLIDKALDLTARDINRADLIWCISNYTKGKVNQYYPNRKQKDIVVACGCNTRYRKISISESQRNAIFSEYDIKKGFYLFVGTLEPRKNLKYLLQLVPDIYKQTGYKLLVVGGRGWKNSDLYELVESNPIYKEAVLFCGYLSNERLVELYNLATCYVSTALNEGFGIPQLEAMHCGCPVISPHNSAMIEVVSGRGVSIDGWGKKEWTGKIVRMLTDEEYRSKFLNPDTSEYDWGNMIKRVDNYVKSHL